MARIKALLLSFLWFDAGVLFAWFASLVYYDEISPAVAQGSFNITTDSMILNHTFQGNEVYLMLAFYLALSAFSLWRSYRAFRVNRQAHPG